MIGLSSSMRRRLLTQQQGMVHGVDYVSLLKGLELPRTGLVHRFASARFANRAFELRSGTQLCVFMEQYFRADVVDVREHVPLFITHTTEIATRKGLPHPGGLTNPEVLLTDLVVTRQHDEEVTGEAILTRHAASATTPAFETGCTLFRTYWAQCGARFSVCRRDGVNSPRASNLRWLFPVAEPIICTGVTDGQHKAQAVLVDELALDDHVNIREACRAATRRGFLPAGGSICAFRKMLAMQVLRVDLCRCVIPSVCLSWPTR